MLFSASGENIPVCKTFFLSTLSLNSDKMIKTAIAKRKGSIPDQRGWHQPPLNYTTTEGIKNHIYSYGPCISHYRRYSHSLFIILSCYSFIEDVHQEDEKELKKTRSMSLTKH